MSQLLLPVGDPPPALLDRIRKIALLAKLAHDEARKVNAELYAHGRRFPDGFQIALNFLELAADDLFLILRVPITVGTGNENPLQRDDHSEAASRTQAPAENGRQAPR